MTTEKITVKQATAEIKKRVKLLDKLDCESIVQVLGKRALVEILANEDYPGTAFVRGGVRPFACIPDPTGKDVPEEREERKGYILAYKAHVSDTAFGILSEAGIVHKECRRSKAKKKLFQVVTLYKTASDSVPVDTAKDDDILAAL